MIDVTRRSLAVKREETLAEFPCKKPLQYSRKIRSEATSSKNCSMHRERRKRGDRLTTRFLAKQDDREVGVDRARNFDNSRIHPRRIESYRSIRHPVSSIKC